MTTKKVKDFTWMDLAPKVYAERRIPLTSEVQCLSAVMTEGGRDLLLATHFLELVDFGWYNWEDELRKLNEDYELNEVLPSWLISTFRHDLRTELVLGNYMMEARHAMLIAEVLNCPSRLKRFVTHFNNFGDVGGIYLAKGLAINDTLTDIHLASCCLGDEAAVAMAAMLKVNTQLEALNLAGNRFSDVGGKALADSVGQCVQLTEINLADNPIADKDGLVSNKMEESGFVLHGRLVYMKGVEKWIPPKKKWEISFQPEQELTAAMERQTSEDVCVFPGVVKPKKQLKKVTGPSPTTKNKKYHR